MKSASELNLTELMREHYVIADGRSMSKIDYPELFETIGYEYGGNGNAFRLPDLRNKYIRSFGNEITLTTTEGEIKISNPIVGETILPQTSSSAFVDHRHFMFQDSAATKYDHMGLYDVDAHTAIVVPGVHGNHGTISSIGGDALRGSTSRAVHPSQNSEEGGYNYISNNDIDVKESRPYTIVMTPLIKIK